MTELVDPFESSVEERIEVGGAPLVLERPADAEALIDEDAFERDEFLPYWAHVWPAGIALAEVVAARAPGGRVLELGCGLGLPSLAAARSGASVTASDWAADALAFLERNAARNGVRVECVLARWDDPEPLRRRGPFPLVLAADVLYEARNAALLAELLPAIVAPGGEALVADPGRPHAPVFLDAMRARNWAVEPARDERLPRGAVHRLWRERHSPGTER